MTEFVGTTPNRFNMCSNLYYNQDVRYPLPITRYLRVARSHFLLRKRDRTLYLIANFYCIYILLYISLLKLILGIAISG